MTKFRLNKAMLFVLVTSMLSMQWSTAHIHLAEHHDHDGSHHQHNTKAHAHQSFSHNDDFVDSSRQIYQQEVKVVELGNDCNVHRRNNIESSGFSNSKRRYIDYSTISLRAPPKFS